MVPTGGMLDVLVARAAIDALERERSDYLAEVQRFSTQFGAEKASAAPKSAWNPALMFLHGRMI